MKNNLIVDGIQKHTADSESVHAWVRELQSDAYKPVLLYKIQGVKGLTIGESEAFGPDDFALCIQTQFQCDMLKKFGKKCVCIDSTHSTNHYDFPLTTIMIIDEFGEGVPVAYMISNSEVAAVIEAFYESIKSRVGSLELQVFMLHTISAHGKRYLVPAAIPKSCCVSGILIKVGEGL